MAKKFMAGLPEDENKDKKFSSAPSTNRSGLSILEKYLKKLVGIPVDTNEAQHSQDSPTTSSLEKLPEGSTTNKKLATPTRSRVPDGSVGDLSSSKVTELPSNRSKTTEISSDTRVKVPDGSVGGVSTESHKIPEGSVGNLSESFVTVPDGSTSSPNTDIKIAVPDGSVGDINDNTPNIPDGSVGNVTTNTKVIVPEGSLGSTPTERKVVVPEGEVGGISDTQVKVPEGSVGNVSSTEVPIPENDNYHEIPDPITVSVPDGTVGEVSSTTVIVPEGSVGGVSDDYINVPDGSVGGITEKTVSVPDGSVGSVSEDFIRVPEGSVGDVTTDVIIERPGDLKGEGDVVDDRSETGVLSEYQVPILDKYLKPRYVVPEGSTNPPTTGKIESTPDDPRDYRTIGITDNKVVELPSDTGNTSITEGKIVELPDNDLQDLSGDYKSNTKLPDGSVGGVTTEKLDKLPYDSVTKVSASNSKLGLPENYQGTVEEFDDGSTTSATKWIAGVKVTSRPASANTSSDRIWDKYEDANAAAKTAQSINSITDRITGFASKYETLMGKYASLGQFGEKAASYVSAIFGSSAFTPDTMVPKHQVQNLGALSLVRWTTQGTINSAMGATKQALLDELIETASRAQNRLLYGEKQSPRLPSGYNTPNRGDDFNLQTLITGDDSTTNSQGYQIFTQKVALTDDKTTLGNAILEKIGLDALTSDDKSKDRTVVYPVKYIQNNAMYTTLKELCNSTGENIKTLDGLKEILLKSDLTTSKKVTDLKMSLDSNHVWEIILEPYVGTDNGGTTFLPDFSEIEYRNQVQFGSLERTRTEAPITSYGKWLPINSFELQYRRSNQKGLALFDGDIYFPTSMEFTNELRLTFVDDQYKSFRWYFNRCAEAAVYKVIKVARSDKIDTNKIQEEINAEFGDSSPVLKDNSVYTTIIDKTRYETAMYKNITFKCTIYVMKGDYATVEKFILLLVMRDHQIEYSGDSDANGNELSVNFTIVGELFDESGYDYDRKEYEYRSSDIPDFRSGYSGTFKESDEEYTKMKNTFASLLKEDDSDKRKEIIDKFNSDSDHTKDLELYYKYQSQYSAMADYEVIIDKNGKYKLIDKQTASGGPAEKTPDTTESETKD
jgi:hypothetical protein